MKWPLIAYSFSAIKGHFCSLLKSSFIFCFNLSFFVFARDRYFPSALCVKFGNLTFTFSYFPKGSFRYPILFYSSCLLCCRSLLCRLGDWDLWNGTFDFLLKAIYRCSQQKLRSDLCQASHRRVGIRLHQLCLYFKIGSLTFSWDCTSCLWLYCSTFFSQFQ